MMLLMTINGLEQIYQLMLAQQEQLVLMAHLEHQEVVVRQEQVV